MADETVRLAVAQALVDAAFALEIASRPLDSYQREMLAVFLGDALAEGPTGELAPGDEPGVYIDAFGKAWYSAAYLNDYEGETVPMPSLWPTGAAA